MTEFIFCLASILFLGWVILLKLQVDRLKKQNVQLQAELQKLIKKKTGDVEVGHETEVWGQRPSWFRPT